MFSFKPIYFVIFTLILHKTQAEISDKRLCVDKNCSELVSIGKTLLRYSSIEEHILSFKPNEDVKVYSHGAGSRPELVGVEISGKRGYINKEHLRETQLIKRPKIVVDTEIAKSKPEVPLEGTAGEIKPDLTKESFEFVDGTKIPLDLASTEAPVELLNTQSSKEPTKPLESIPENQNVKPSVPSEPVVNSEEKNNVVSEGQPPKSDTATDEDLKGDDDDDSEEAEAEDDDTDDDDEEESESTNKAIKNNDGTTGSSETIALSTKSSNVSDEGSEAVQNNSNIIKNPGENSVKIEETVSEIRKEDNVVPDNINVQSSEDSDLNSKSFVKPENVPSTGQVEITASENTTVDNKNLNQETKNILGKESEVAKANIEGSPVTPDVISTIKNEPETKETVEEKPKTAQNLEDIKKENFIENIKNENETEIILDVSDTSKPTEKFQSLPESTTESSIDVEVVPPLDVDIVTPDPSKVDSEDINSIPEDSKNETENTAETSYNLPSDLKPHLKDPEDGAEIRVKEKESRGWMEGMFSTGTAAEDRDVGHKAGTPSVNEITNNSILEEVPVAIQQEDSAPVQNSEDLQMNVPVASEEIPPSSEQDNLTNTLNSEQINVENSDSKKENSWGFISNVISTFFGESKSEESVEIIKENKEAVKENSDFTTNSVPDPPQVQELTNEKDVNTNIHTSFLSNHHKENAQATKEFCDKDGEACPKYEPENIKPGVEISRSNSFSVDELQVLFVEAFSSDLFLYLTTTAMSVIILVFGMVILDKCRREGPLIARINKLEQQLLATMKENEMLQDKATQFVEEKTQLVVETVPNEVVEELNQKLAEMDQVKQALEDQIQALEKELDTSTEVGIELNKIISEMLNSSDGSEIIRENIEQMQKKLSDQQETINTVTDTLSLKETENYELRSEIEISNKKVTDLQNELDKMVEKLLQIEGERDKLQSLLENEIAVYQTKCKEAITKEHTLNSEIQTLKQQLTKSQRVAEVKVKEYNILKESLNEVKSMKNDKNALKSLLEVSEIKAQLEQLKSENLKYSEQLTQEREVNVAYATKIENLTQELGELKEKYNKADKDKVEIETKLNVLNNYFKEKEDQMQKEISKYESLWVAKEGEATSTTERIRYMQEELQNYKAQNESLKQEIVNQEVELKSQISMLEKKAHENWVTNRQTERKLEETKQEAAQLRHRLTLRERAIAEGNNQIRMQSPLHQNGELPISPPPIDPTQSPPFFNPRDHLTKSPPIPGLPPPPFFPPLGATPFIPPPPLDGPMPPLGDIPHGHFMPPLPPGMFPGDHRPPPLGRMSSPPPVGGRYTPESTVYSDYDRYSRRSPSPPYDSEYGASPPPIRGYSPYQDRLRDDRREYQRPQARSNGRNSKGIHSSGSENDSLGKITKKPQRKD